MTREVYNFKLIDNIFSISYIIILVTVCLACSGGSDPKPETQVERVTKLLVSNGSAWSATASGSSVKIDGADVTTDLFKDFTIKFSDNNTFTTTGTTPVWLRSDTWSFKDENAGIIVRGQDNKEVIIETISATELKLTLQWDQTLTTGGRSSALQGKHEFILKK